jgi:hypothetical protein
MDQVRRILILISLGGACVLTYQNCAQSPRENQSPLALQSTEEVNQQLSAAVKSADTGVCEPDEAYSCESRKYGHSERNDVRTGQECVGTSCVDVLYLSFNTSQQIQSCADCSSEDIHNRYEYSEAYCSHLKFKIDGLLALRAEGSDVAAALANAKGKCRQLASTSDTK